MFNTEKDCNTLGVYFRIFMTSLCDSQSFQNHNTVDYISLNPDK